MKTLTFSRQADAEYTDLVRTAWERWPGQAEDILGRMHETFQRLRQFPFSAPAVDPPFKRFPDLRFEVLDRVGHRVVYYRIRNDEVQIMRIVHGSMDTRAIFGERE